jgi:peptidoglycan/LPS O-acetylase OafA/YrhL
VADRGPTKPRLAAAALAAFVAFTAAWIAVGLANHGDAFPQGPAVYLQPLALIAPATAGWLAWRRRPSRGLWTGLAIGAALALSFWLLVRDGWWAVGPPPIPSGQR